MSSSQCLACSNPTHFLGTDNLTCSEGCGVSEYKDLNEKKCIPCSDSNCQSCDDTGQCSTCKAEFFLSSGSCTKCPTGCSSCTSLTKCESCSDENHFLGTDGFTCSENCPEGEYKSNQVTKKCLSCPDNCLECTFNSESKCSKCKEGFEPKGEGCIAITPEVPSTNTKASELKIINSVYIESPSRARIQFSQKITSKISISNIKLLLTKTSEDQKIEEVEAELVSVKLEENEKFLKVYFNPKNNIENGVLKITLNEENLIIDKTNNSITFTEKEIMVSDVSFYFPEKEIAAVSTTSKVASYSVTFLGAASLLGSYTSLFEIVKTFQMIDFLVYLNVNHPSNLQSFLENLELQFIENLPNPFKHAKDDLCSVEKEKFEEDGVTCYVLHDQGAYLTLNIGLVTIFVLLKIVGNFIKSDYLKKKASEKLSLSFWIDLLEAIRLELFTTMFTSLTKLGLAWENFLSLLSLNIFVVFAFGAVNLATTYYLFYQNEMIYRGYQKRSKIREIENRTLVRQFRLEKKSIDVEDPEDSISRTILNSSNILARDHSINPLIKVIKQNYRRKIQV